MDEILYIALAGTIRVAVVRDRNGRSITADLYRSLADLREGRVMERKVKLSFD